MALLLAAAVQAPSADTIARQLNSQDTQTVAWGAYNAGAYHRVDAIPRLQQILESPPVTAASEERAFIGVVMDLRAMSPGTGLSPFRAHTVETVAWSTADALSQRVQELRSLVERRFRSLVDRARQLRSLPPDVVSQPRIDLHIVDQRSDKAVPLPTFGR